MFEVTNVIEAPSDLDLVVSSWVKDRINKSLNTSQVYIPTKGVDNEFHSFFKTICGMFPKEKFFYSISPMNGTDIIVKSENIMLFIGTNEMFVLEQDVINRAKFESEDYNGQDEDEADVSLDLIPINSSNGYPKEGVVCIKAYADREVCEALFNKFNYNHVSNVRPPSYVNWYFSTSDGTQRHYTHLLPYNKIPAINEMYPFINTDINEYFTEFKESNSQVLLLIGEPGTGKTSLVRHWLTKNRLNAMFTFDENIMQTDQFFLTFMMGGDPVLIIEDADLLLNSRKDHGNKLMAKFLNASDGLLKFGHKKIIFTTNLKELKEVDSALLREGRCFDVVKFRALNVKETSTLKSKLKLPKTKYNDSGTLSKILNPKKKKIDIESLTGNASVV